MKTVRGKKLTSVIIALPAGVFVAEVVAMLLVQYYEGPYGITILLDAIITTSIMFPIIYMLSYRPLLEYIAERERSESIKESRLKLIQLAVSHTKDELLQATLDEIEALTGSTIGFFHFLEADQKNLQLQTWSTNTLQNMCKAEGKGSHYSVEQAGVWADCVRQRKPVVHNNYAALPNRRGTPQGHATILREVTVPIMRQGRVVAILGVGNKPKEYNTNDVELVSMLADFAWDIIDSKRTEDALRASEEKFHTLADWTYDWEQWLDPQGNIVYISPSCERISGYGPEEFIRDPSLLVTIVHPEERNYFIEHRKLIHNEKSEISSIEYRVIARDGSEHWIEHICRPLFGKDNKYLGRRISNRDITDRKQVQIEIVERNRKEIILTQAIHSMQIDIARDLHDTIGQNIGYLRMKLDYLSEKDFESYEKVKPDVVNMLKMANDSYDLIRGTLAVLQSGGLADPLPLFIQYANQVEERSQFKVNVSSQGEPRPLPPNHVRQLFFVFREALSNIEKHANATRVSVELIWFDDCLSLNIDDNGIGFRLDKTPVTGHYGLKFMQERINLLQGDFLIQSNDHQGTRIEITLPYS